MTNIIDNTLWKGVFFMGSGTILAQVIIIATMPVLTRLFSPADFGVLGIYNSFLAIIITLISLRYELAIPVPSQPKKAASLLLLCILLVGVLSFIFSIILIIFGHYLAELFNISSAGIFFSLLILGIFASGIYQALNYWAIRIQNYPSITYTRLNQSISGTSCNLICGLLNFGSSGLLLGSIIANAAGIGTFLKQVRQEWNLFRSVSVSEIKQSVLEFREFPLFSAPATLLYTLSQQLPVFFLSSMYGIAEVGLYTIAYQIVSFPTYLIGSSIAQVFYGEAAKTMNDDPNILKILYIDTVKKLAVISIPVFFAIALLAPSVFPVIFGESWRPAGIFILPLALYAASAFIAVPTNKLAVYGFNRWQLAFNIMRFIMILCGFLIACLLRFDNIVTLFIYGGLSTISYVVLFYLNIAAIDHLISQYTGQTR